MRDEMRWWLGLTAVALTALLAGCPDPCADGACDEIPDDPWTPDDDDAGDDDAYGDDDSGDDDAGDDDTTPEIVVVRDCVSHLEYDPPGDPATVTVAGEWNGFDDTADPMEDPDDDGVFTFDIELPAGEYGFKYVIDGSWEGDPPPQVYTHWNGSSENRNLRVGDCTVPLLQTVSASATAAGDLEVVVQFASAADEEPLDAGTVVATVGGDPVTPSIDVASGEIVISATGLPLGKHSVRVWARDAAGRASENEPLFVPLWVEDEPFEWTDAIMYFVFTDRFRNGDWGEDPPLFDPVPGVPDASNYAGGDFLGVIHAMDENYFEQLGVQLLWLSPMYENPDDGYVGSDGNMYSGYHGYWPVLPTTPESRFGDVDADAEDRLHELIDYAHDKGIRVLFDLVLNHVHEDHVYVGQHPGWFPGGGCVCGDPGCGWDDHAIDCWFRDYLPDLNYKEHEIVMQQIADVEALVKEYDVDAFRVDAAKHMDHVIMRSLSMRLRDDFELGGGAPFYLVGETYVFTDGHQLIMDYVADYELDAQFDFPLLWTAQDAFAGWTGFDTLEAQVVNGENWYGGAPMSPFIGNHDIPRYATELAGNDGGPWGYTPDLMADGGQVITQWDIINRMSMGLCFVLTQPGVPLIYYGDEIGLAGSGDPDNRRMMNFDPYLSANQAELLDRVRVLGQTRAGSEALRRGSRQQLWVDGDLYVYARDAGNGDVAIVAMNKSGGNRSEAVNVPQALGVEGSTLTDAIGGGTIQVSGQSATISLDSMQYAIYLP